MHASIFIGTSPLVMRCTTGTKTSHIRLCARPCTSTCKRGPRLTITPFIRTTHMTHGLKVKIGTKRSLDLRGLECVRSRVK